MLPHQLKTQLSLVEVKCITKGVRACECRHRLQIQKLETIDLHGGDKLHQHFVNLFGKGLNVSGIHLQPPIAKK